MTEIEILKVPPFISIPDLKKFFAIGQWGAYKLLKTGQIKGYRKPGCGWIIATTSVLKYLKKIDPQIQNIEELHI